MDINNSYQINSNKRTDTLSVFNLNIADEKKRIALGKEELKIEILEKWNKEYANAQIFPPAIVAMHPEMRDFLLSFSLVAIYDNIAKQARLDEKGRNKLPQVVWKIAQEKNWDDLDKVLESFLPLIRPEHVAVASLLQQNILSKARMLAEKPVQRNIVSTQAAEKKILQISLAEAMKKYPEIEQQSITTNQIKLRNSSAPVRPSIKNWITDFHASMGAGKHSPIDRGNFLFHGENGKNLTSTERQKVGMILKSLDEQSLLTIDPVAQRVVFEGQQQEQQKNKEEIILPKKDLSLNQAAYFDANANKASSNAAVEDFVARFQQKNFSDQSQVRRTSLPDINLKQPVQEYVHENVSRAPIDVEAKSLSHDIAPIDFATPQASIVKTEQIIKQEDKVDNFFQLPKSKPPLGSEDFHVAIAPVVKEDFTALKTTVQTNLSAEKKTVEQNISIDPDMMSDELLYKMIQEKKIKQLPRNNENYNMDTISFSSPQRLPAEQDTKSAQPSLSKTNQRNVVNLKN